VIELLYRVFLLAAVRIANAEADSRRIARKTDKVAGHDAVILHEFF
jgi:hypothetical protein